jgi:D-glycero-D-manno-heptose 1,7-bisphosphate phosphatase
VFLDRDGVLNRAIVRNGKPYPPQSLDEVEIPPGTAEATSALKQAGFSLIVVTNQPDVARGTQLLETVESINRDIGQKLGIDDFRVCYHDDKDDCPCRKPKPGLLLDAAKQLDIDLPSSYMVGDRWRDIAAGKTAGCRTVWIDYGYSEKQPDDFGYRALSFTDASQWILAQPNHNQRGMK